MSSATEQLFHKLICLFAEIGRESLLQLLLNSISTISVEDFLAENRDEINSVLAQHAPGSVICAEDASGLDISSIIILLCHVCGSIEKPREGWEKIPPSDDDNSVGACILRLKEYRNVFLKDRNSMQIDKLLFDGIWTGVKKTLKNIAKRIGAAEENDLKRRLKDLEGKTIELGTNCQNRNVQTVLRWYEQDVHHTHSRLSQAEKLVKKEISQCERQDAGDVTDAVVHDGSGGQRSQRGSLQSELENLEISLNHIRLDQPQISSSTAADRNSLSTTLTGLQQCRHQVDKVQKNLYVLFSILQIEPTKVHVEARKAAGFQGVSGQGPSHQGLAATRGEAPAQNPAMGSLKPILDPDIKRFSRDLFGRDWELTFAALGYSRNQLEAAKEMYPRQIETRQYYLLKQWHDVVLRCGENPKLLLATAFADEGNNEAVETILGPGQLALVKSNRIQCKRETMEAIKAISFEVSNSGFGRSGNINVGAPGAFNFFPNSDIKLGDSVSIQSGGQTIFNPDVHGFATAFQELQHGSDVNIGGPSAFNFFNSSVETKPGANLVIGASQNVRAELPDSIDGALPGIPPSSQLKKKRDDNFTESQWDCVGVISKSVCSISSPHFCGTAFRVGTHFLMTAYHLIRDIQKNDGLPLSSDKVFVSFHEEIRQCPEDHYKLGDDFIHDETLDVAVVEISNPDKNLPIPLPLSTIPIEENIESVSLIGYGNPRREYVKHIDPNCQVVQKNSPDIVAAHTFLQQQCIDFKKNLFQKGIDHTLVDRGYSGYDEPYNVIINCFSEKGASGAPLIDCRNAKHPSVVGVLTHGLPHCFWYLDVPWQLLFQENHRLEVGTRMSAIKEIILDHKVPQVDTNSWF